MVHNLMMVQLNNSIKVIYTCYKIYSEFIPGQVICHISSSYDGGRAAKFPISYVITIPCKAVCCSDAQ